MNGTKRVLIIVALLLACVAAVVWGPICGVAFLVAFEFASAMPARGCGANSLGTLAASQILVMEALALIYTKRPMLKNISVGFTDRDPNGVPNPFAVLNQSVVTRVIGIPAVSAFGSAAANAVTTDVSVNLSAHDQVLFQFTPAQYSATNRDLIRESVEPLTISVGNAMIDDVAANWTPANFPVRTGADAAANKMGAFDPTQTKLVVGAGWSYDTLTTIGAIMDAAGVPDFNKRFVAVNAPVWQSFQSDQRIVGYFWNQNNGGAITNGYLPKVNGFDLAKYPNIGSVAGNNLVAFAGFPDSSVYAARAMRAPQDMSGAKDVPFPGIQTTVTETEVTGGLTLNMEIWIDPTTFNLNVRLHWLHGHAVGNANNGELITSQ